jgi:hypothetical protein
MTERVQQLGITIDVTPATSNPFMPGMPPGTRHFNCRLSRADQTITVIFSQGPGVRTDPDAATVLDCLASDAAGVLNRDSFDMWAEDYGYDLSTGKTRREARLQYDAVCAQTRALERLLQEHFDVVVFHTEAV